LQLINNKIEINSLELVGISANLNRDTKAIFNFDYIIKDLLRQKTKE
jgi:hypothetical protein